MEYQSYEPSSIFELFIKCYWTLQVEDIKNHQKQRIIPDGCIEMIFILGDDIKRFTSKNDFIIQPRAFILGQITKPFWIKPMGSVNSFAIRFYPYGFSSFCSQSIDKFANNVNNVIKKMS